MKKNKILTFINIVLILVSIIGSFYFVFTRDDQLGLILKDASIIITITLPYIIEKLFKIEIDINTKFAYIIFVFMAHFLGATCELYNKIYWFDKFTHTLSGVLTAYAAILLLKHLKKYNKKDRFFNVLFIIAFTLMIASFWEMFEFTANILFGGDAQKVASTGVTDTMMDIIVAFLGSVLYSIVYLFFFFFLKEN